MALVDARHANAAGGGARPSRASRAREALVRDEDARAAGAPCPSCGGAAARRRARQTAATSRRSFVRAGVAHRRRAHDERAASRARTPSRAPAPAATCRGPSRRPAALPPAALQAEAHRLALEAVQRVRERSGRDIVRGACPGLRGVVVHRFLQRAEQLRRARQLHVVAAGLEELGEHRRPTRGAPHSRRAERHVPRRCGEARSVGARLAAPPTAWSCRSRRWARCAGCTCPRRSGGGAALRRARRRRGP